jgi:Domain of unknown function (DUF4272)
MPDFATFYCPEHVPLTLIELRRLAEGAEVREQRSGLVRRERSWLVRWPEASVKFHLMDPRKLPGHLEGFAGFIRAHSSSRAVAEPLQARVRAVKQVIGSVIEPGASGHVERLLAALAARRGALVFRPSGLFDEQGRPALAPRPPQPSGEPQILKMFPDEAQRTPARPSAERVRRRAIALQLIGLRGYSESMPGASAVSEKIRAEAMRLGVIDEMEPLELALLAAPAGALGEQQAVDATWRAEGAVVLTWALGLVDRLPPHDQMTEMAPFAQALGLFECDAPAQVPRLRPADELEAMSRHLLGLHWRLRDFRLHPRAMDFAAFSRQCWFGSFDLLDVPLVNGDLAVGGLAIAKADPRVLSIAAGVALERHWAINWLMGDAGLYSEVDVST